MSKTEITAELEKKELKKLKRKLERDFIWDLHKLFE